MRGPFLFLMLLHFCNLFIFPFRISLFSPGWTRTLAFLSFLSFALQIFSGILGSILYVQDGCGGGEVLGRSPPTISQQQQQQQPVVFPIPYRRQRSPRPRTDREPTWVKRLYSPSPSKCRVSLLRIVRCGLWAGLCFLRIHIYMK